MVPAPGFQTGKNTRLGRGVWVKSESQYELQFAHGRHELTETFRGNFGLLAGRQPIGKNPALHLLESLGQSQPVIDVAEFHEQPAHLIRPLTRLSDGLKGHLGRQISGLERLQQRTIESPTMLGSPSVNAAAAVQTQRSTWLGKPPTRDGASRFLATKLLQRQPCSRQSCVLSDGCNSTSRNKVPSQHRPHFRQRLWAMTVAVFFTWWQNTGTRELTLRKASCPEKQMRRDFHPSEPRRMTN